VQLPADIPVTTPAVLTVAIAVLLLLQTPPDVASLSVMDEDLITVLFPEIEDTVGDWLINIRIVEDAVPQRLVTVTESFTSYMFAV
jgi:hypothetical protein